MYYKRIGPQNVKTCDGYLSQSSHRRKVLQRPDGYIDYKCPNCGSVSQSSHRRKILQRKNLERVVVKNSLQDVSIVSSTQGRKSFRLRPRLRLSPHAPDIPAIPPNKWTNELTNPRTPARSSRTTEQLRNRETDKLTNFPQSSHRRKVLQSVQRAHKDPKEKLMSQSSADARKKKLQIEAEIKIEFPCPRHPGEPPPINEPTN